MRASIAVFFSKAPKWVWGGLIGVVLFWTVAGTLQFINLRILGSMPPDELGRSQFTVYGVIVWALLTPGYMVTQRVFFDSWVLGVLVSSLPYFVLGAAVGDKQHGCAVIGGAIWFLVFVVSFVLWLALALNGARGD
jgi:hypothetical protein